MYICEDKTRQCSKNIISFFLPEPVKTFPCAKTRFQLKPVADKLLYNKQKPCRPSINKQYVNNYIPLPWRKTGTWASSPQSCRWWTHGARTSWWSRFSCRSCWTYQMGSSWGWRGLTWRWPRPRLWSESSPSGCHYPCWRPCRTRCTPHLQSRWLWSTQQWIHNFNTFSSSLASSQDSHAQLLKDLENFENIPTRM